MGIERLRDGVGGEQSKGNKTDWINNHLLRYLLEEAINKALSMYFLTLSGGRYTIVSTMQMNEEIQKA